MWLPAVGLQFLFVRSVFNRQVFIQMLTLPLTSSGTLGNLLKPTVLSLLTCKMGTVIVPASQAWCSEPCLTHSRC